MAIDHDWMRSYDVCTYKVIPLSAICISWSSHVPSSCSSHMDSEMQSSQLHFVKAMASSYIHPPLARATTFTAMMAGCSAGLSSDAASATAQRPPDLRLNAYRMDSYQMPAVSCMSGHVRTMDTTIVQICYQTWAPACSCLCRDS